MITAPFNFVPVSEKVFFPEWSKYVSHDAPMRESLSGEIQIKITAQSPIFIKGHEEDRFCNFQGRFFIPATSVKGMVRNVLEIMSFSKMSFIQDSTYAVRDLRNRNLYMDNMKPKNIRAGWFYKENGKYYIDDCGIPGRISFQEIDKAFGSNLAWFFSQRFDPKKSEQKTAKFKYQKIGKVLPSIRVAGPNKTQSNPKDSRQFYEYDSNGQEATLVMTGQASKRMNSGKMGDGKGFEFLFFEPQERLEVSPEVFEKFKFAYFDGRDTQPKESPDWSFWKERLYRGEKIPVFFQREGKVVKHFGLSYLYKLPYNYSILDGLPPAHKKSEKDLAQTLFGYVDEQTKDALKGRVQFSHFLAAGEIKELDSRKVILGQPRASYYPIYIHQDGNVYKTYMDPNFRIAGWKRYPVHLGNHVINIQEKDIENDDVATRIRPLAEGAVFEGRVRYFNLTRVELGALVSAFTFHNTPDTFHNIGMAKPLGYGKVKVEVKEIEKYIEFMREFEKTMVGFVENWHESDQLKELITMATEPKSNEHLVYMDVKRYAKEKNDTNYLYRYSRFPQANPRTAVSLLSEDEREAAIHERERLKQQIAMQKDFEKAKESEDLNVLRGFIQKYGGCEEAQEIKQRLEQLERKKAEEKFKEVNEKAQRAFEELMKNKKNKKKFDKDCKKFIEKWSKEKNNKNSPYILEIVEKVKNSCK